LVREGLLSIRSSLGADAAFDDETIVRVDEP
jgi:hypothetical protein